MNNKSLKPLSDAEKKLLNKVVEERTRVEHKFPLVFMLLATFGFVSVLYGFEKLIDRVSLFEENPWILLGVGILTLLLTGTAYRKLH